MVAIAHSGMIRFRFIQDRADFFIDIGSPKEPNKWVNLYDVLDEMKEAKLIPGDYKYINRIDSLGTLVSKIFAVLQQYVLMRVS